MSRYKPPKGRNLVPWSCYLSPEHLAKLEILSTLTQTSKSTILREALDMLFEHHAEAFNDLRAQKILIKQVDFIRGRNSL
jgi:predicted DNA-binding protein